MSADVERARALLDNARAALDREGQLLDVVRALNTDIGQLHAELAEIRDGMVALSNRIEAATRGAAASRHVTTEPQQHYTVRVERDPADDNDPIPWSYAVYRTTHGATALHSGWAGTEAEAHEYAQAWIDGDGAPCRA